MRKGVWRARAVCATETASVAELWTPDSRPPVGELEALQAVCGACPVRPSCARDALSESAQCGVYAGVWVPEARNAGSWRAARRRLAVIAGGGGRHRGRVGGAA